MQRKLLLGVDHVEDVLKGTVESHGFAVMGVLCLLDADGQSFYGRVGHVYSGIFRDRTVTFTRRGERRKEEGT